MIINLEKIPDCKALLRLEVPSDDAKAERNQIVKLFAKQAKIPGFRPGKTPESLIEKRFKTEIESEFEERIVRQAMQKAQEEKVDIIRISEIREQSHNIDGTYTATIELITAPDFELPDYKDLEVQVPKIEVTDEQLNESLDQIRERFADYEDVENRGLQMNDFAVINYKGSIEGKPVGEVLPLAPATLAQNTGFWLKMNDESFLPGFCSPLVDAKLNETVSLNVTIPEDYQAEELRGQNIDYEVEIVSIKEQVLPELNDEFADKINPGKSLEEIKSALHEQMTEQRKGYRKEMITNQILSKINSDLDFELPKEMVMRETQSRVNDIFASNTERGVSEEELVEHQEEIIESAGQQAHSSVKTSFILEQIAEKEEIEVSQEEILERVSQIAARQKTSVKQLTKQLEKKNGFGRIYNGIRIEKTLDLLRDSAVIKEVEPEELETQ
ncbi:MAG: trigger factor [Verrucomicrobiota bacterium]|nr:trigger factor [Verrucomicrobiota bacterium]MEE2967025.1 trigger factor [Verrucomicrobiota bacterium]|tara:strand:+ start:3183 stop:4511 length:1329 start_codon:yes stop_codon:yes gene_type:complete